MKTKVLTLGIAFALGLGSAAMAQNTSAVKGSAPKAGFDEAGTLTNALKPIAGKTYTYSVNASNFGDGSTIHWIATQNINLLNAFGGAGVIAADNTGLIVNASAVYNDDATVTKAANSVDIKWNSKITSAITDVAANPILVAAKVEDCSNNLKVYSITPVNGFMVDIKNVENASYASLGYGEADDQCFDKIASATWSGTGMVYDYGTNILYYEVVAANFSDEWVPTFQITGLKDNQTATLEWSYNAYNGTEGTSNSAVKAIVNNTDLTMDAVKIASATETTTGVSIYVKVTVKNNAYEGLTDDNIVLSVKGTVNAGKDKDQLAVGGDGGYADADSNVATQTFLKRPTITAGDSSLPLTAQNSK
ncbi:MAG: hypothetical protein ACK5LR_08065 [Mangrovibacterium sp.]